MCEGMEEILGGEKEKERQAGDWLRGELPR